MALHSAVLPDFLCKRLECDSRRCYAVNISLLTLNISILHVNIAMMFSYRNIQSCIVLAVAKIESRAGKLKQTCKTLFSAMKKVATLTPSNPAFRLQVFSPKQRADLLKQTAPKVSLKEETSIC